ncbi:MAG: restriction endonuclease [Methylacidiphilales bacterium]|nr:restriction endonuclease [Candidatus Methylacidiphilales bacterium]
MNWTDKLVKFCEEYNIPIEYLADVLSDPKVVPMIRGKAFEFSVAATLSRILNPEEWKVDKPIINSQLGLHDTDVRVTHLLTKKVLTVECKLAKNSSYRRITNSKLSGKYVNQISVKCMRSRTLGTEMVEKIAPKLGVSGKVLAVHNDQYLPSNFDVVITSIGNAFYKTNPQTKEFEWNPTLQAIQFLKTINETSIELKDFAFSSMYIAKSNDISISHSTGVICTRKKCDNPTNCGFIPNYPIILFEDGNKVPFARWFPIEDSESLLTTIIV